MTIFFNAFHSPIGAHSSFTLGCKGKSGGLGLELGRPSEENLYIGLEKAGGGGFEALPFWKGGSDESLRYDHAASKTDSGKPPLLVPFANAGIKRDFKVCSDLWTAGDLSLEIFSPVMSAPDPETASAEEQKFAYCPAVVAELTIDNRKGKAARRAFFGYEGDRNDGMNLIEKGVASGSSTAIMTDCPDAVPAQGFGFDFIMSQKHPENWSFQLGGCALLLFNVPAGAKMSFRLALCFHRGGIVTSGAPCSYWYSRFFKTISEAGSYALANFELYRKKAQEGDRLFASKSLNEHQSFQLAHAIRSYYGSTQLLDWDGKPFWIVNEGEYRMLNTFDLTVDQLFFEMRLNPWTVRNELDLFVSRYSYTDKLHFPGGGSVHEGGLSFTHDMGSKNCISRPGYSSYECFGLTGCFSHMTHEQLVNWILCAAVYVKGTGENPWREVFERCFQSMLNRDNPDPALRNGIMSLDSSRTLDDGAEITTYDSLDKSLGQSRGNVYMAVKCFAAYLALEGIFKGSPLAAQAHSQAVLAANSIAGALNKEGFIPAIIGEGCDSKVIPAIEGLIFPWALGLEEALDEKGEFAALLKALRTHFDTVMKPGVCLYPDGGWKLSSSADNSWLSKIYLCQFVAREIFGCKASWAGIDADKAHSAWLLKEENLYWAWSDQMSSGVAKGSKYYPRGVTAVLWLDERA